MWAEFTFTKRKWWGGGPPEKKSVLLLLLLLVENRMGRITTVFPLSFSLSLSFSLQICNNNSDRYEPEESNTHSTGGWLYRASGQQPRRANKPNTTVPADYTIPNVCKPARGLSLSLDLIESLGAAVAGLICCCCAAGKEKKKNKYKKKKRSVDGLCLNAAGAVVVVAAAAADSGWVWLASPEREKGTNERKRKKPSPHHFY